MGKTARLIPLQYNSPADNMAIDQVLLETVGQNKQATLRLYGWDQPTLSLGYFQSVADRDKHANSESLAIVRRSTGGGAIVHHHELTYSIAVPLQASRAGAHHQLYRDTHDAMIDAIGRFGVRADRFADVHSPANYSSPFLCFMDRTAEDLIVHGYKVLGSAQRKSRYALLQHGSLLIRCSPYAPELPGLADLSGRSISIEEISEQFTIAVGNKLSVLFDISDLSGSEANQAAEIAAARYGSAAWTARR